MAKIIKQLRRNMLGMFLLAAAGAVWAMPVSHGAPERVALASATVTPTPKISPIQSPSPSPTVQVQTLESLQAKIRSRLLSSNLSRGRVGLKIVSLGSGKVIFENDAEKFFVPASNMKNFTVAAAIEKLTPDFKFVTSVYSDAGPDAEGVVKGDLRIYGRGDVTMSTGFNNGDYYKGLDNLVDRIAASGIKRVDGALVGDESYFKGMATPETWEWNDLQWYYGAEVTSLLVNDNAVDLKVLPSKAGSPCSVTVLPQNPVMLVNNLCTTSAAGSANTLRVVKTSDRNALEVSGSMPLGEKFQGYVAVSHPASLFLDLLKQRLTAKGIVITGGTRTASFPSPPKQVEIAKLESPPLSVVAGRTMKVSQNLYAETLLWTLGEEIGRKTARSGDSSELGLAVVKSFLEPAVPPGSVMQYDGSGLSRHNLVTPSAVVGLYRYMARQSKYSSAWMNSLSVGGVDGTLGKRFEGTTAAGSLRGKSGTLDQVSALSGYLTTAGGEQLVISIIVNGVPEPKVRSTFINGLVIDLAEFNGKVE